MNMVSYISRHIEESYNKLLHADTYCYARFCVSRCAPFYTKTLSAICAGEQGVSPHSLIVAKIKDRGSVNAGISTCFSVPPTLVIFASRAIN